MAFKNSDDYQKTEEEIILYINKHLNLEFSNENKYLELNKDQVWFKVKPCALITDQNQKITSILSVKSQFLECSLRKDHPYWSHILKFSLYLFAAGLDQGYLCLCQLSHEKEAVTKFISALTIEDSYLLNKKISYSLQPKLTGMKPLEISYQVLEVWKNDHKKDTPITVWKIKIDVQQFSLVIDDVASWWSNHLTESPELNKKEYKLAKKSINKAKNI